MDISENRRKIPRISVKIGVNMKVTGQVMHVKTRERQIVEVEVVLKKPTITIEVDQDFLDAINGLGRTSQRDRVRIGMLDYEATQVGNLYTKMSNLFDELEIPDCSSRAYGRGGYQMP